MARTKIKLHVISHTHWDREWYLPFQGFRMTLTDCIDRLLDLLDRDPDYVAFHLDGQTVPLEDYLEIRPQNRQRLDRHIRSGRLLIGPFYLLNDMALVSAESIVRNMLLGKAICESFGGNRMLVGYVADQFGHIGQMPQILDGFGVGTAIMGRGITLDGLENKSEFWWESPDGSRVLSHHMAGWYNNAQMIPEKPEDAAAYLKERGEHAARYSTIPHCAMMNGCDHLFADEHLSRTLPAVNQIWFGQDVDFEVAHSTLPEYMEQLKNAAKGAPGRKLKVMRGELREQRQGSLLSGTLSTHIELKQLNQLCETLLERYSEPLQAMGWLAGGCYDSDFLWHAWRHVLQCHPHDSICGCSVNQVHKDMATRFEQAAIIAGRLADRGMQNVCGRIAASGFQKDSHALMVVNPSGFEREESLRLKLELPAKDADFNVFQVLDPEGRAVPYQVHSQRREGMLILKSHNLPNRFPARKLDVTLAPVKLPACGYALLEVRPIRPEARDGIGAPPADSAPDMSNWIAQSPGCMENEHLKVTLAPDGRVDVLDKAARRLFTGLNVFEDGGEAGHSYDYAAPEKDEIIYSAGAPGRISTVENGPLSATCRAEFSMSVPVSATDNNRARRTERVALPIVCDVTLRKGSRRVEFRTTVNNNAKDHRLRVLFPTDVAAEYSDAESVYDVVRRPIKRPAKEVFWNGNIPQRAFTDVSDGKGGLAVFNLGLPESFVIDDPRRTIAVTLLRATLAVFREPDLQYGGSAQAQGEFTFDYAVCPHKGDWRSGGVMKEAAAFSDGIRAITCPQFHCAGDLPRALSFASSSDPMFVLTSVKRAEGRDEIVLRFVNLSDSAIQPTVTLGVAPDSARLLAIDEAPGQPLKLEGCKVRLKAGPKRIVTIGLTYGFAPADGGRHGYTNPFSLWK